MHDHLARVPVPPAEVNPAVPGALSRIILHLLEKDPDHRYQSADGLVHDLERLRDADAQAAEALRVGEHDLPPLLLPPSRLVGREAEVAALQAAFDGRARRPLPGGAGRRRAGGGQDGAGRPAAPGGHRQRRLVRGRQVRPVPAGPGVRRGRSGVPRAGPAAAGRTRGRTGRRPRAAPGGARAQRGAGHRGDPGVRHAAGGAPRCRGSADRAGAGAAQRGGGPAGGRVPQAPGGVLRRRPAVGRAHPARPVRPRAQRGADRRPAAGGRLPRG